MSGICGLVRLDGAPASEAQLAPMLAALARRGPDGEGSWSSGPAALGFRLLATTPQAAFERQPFCHEPSDCVIAADARLDDREGLAARLGLDPRLTGDGELILHAYLRWGDEAPLHLLGDYAFVIWDGRKRRLLAVRDPLGMRQLHVAHLPGKLLAFATDDTALVTLEDVPARVNLVRVADFLADLEGADLTSTFYRDVERLPPAHLLICEDAWVSTRRYWSLTPGEPLTGSAEEQTRELLHLFEQAVGDRLRSTGRLGAMLSGGLDSSSVVAIAARLRRQSGEGPLPTFSAISALRPDCVETAMIRQVQALEHVTPFQVAHDGANRFDVLREEALGSLNPFDHHMSLVREVYRLASQHGCNVLLDGVAGDVMLDYSRRPARLVRRGRFVEAWRHCEAERGFFGSPRSTGSQFGSALRTALAPEWLRRWKRDADRIRNRRTPPGFFLPEFAANVGLAERLDLLRRAAPPFARSFAEERASAITHPYLVVGRERYDRVAARCAIEPRDPFIDLRLVRFAHLLPMEQLASSGWTKLVLRKAMAGLLPEPVRWRRGKQHLGSLFNAHLREGAGLSPWHQAVLDQRDVLETIVQQDFILNAASSSLPVSAESIRIQATARWLSVL